MSIACISIDQQGVEIMKSMDVVMINCSYKNFFRNNILS